MNPPTLHIPMAAASRMGVSALAAAAIDCRVLLTSHGRTVAVVDNAERLDESARLMSEAAQAVADAACEAVLARRPARLDLDGLCSKLGLDAERVRTRSAGRAVRQ